MKINITFKSGITKTVEMTKDDWEANFMDRSFWENNQGFFSSCGKFMIQDLTEIVLMEELV